jgi:hypothetical protein
VHIFTHGTLAMAMWPLVRVISKRMLACPNETEAIVTAQYTGTAMARLSGELRSRQLLVKVWMTSGRRGIVNRIINASLRMTCSAELFRP